MQFSIRDMIKRRRSVRTFDATPVKDSDLKALDDFLKKAINPFNTPVEFRLLRADEFGLTSPVVLGSQLYMAAKVERLENYEIGYGYSFETACLYAQSLGLGTVILAASINRPAFEKAMELKENEIMPVATPIGYPAVKKSIRETIMRKGLKADDRISFERLFFNGSFNKGLKQEEAGVFEQALEMGRWAPSAVNKQPWRAVVVKDTVHFYEEKTLTGSPETDIQKLDMGIFLAHFDLTMKETGKDGIFTKSDPGITHAQNVNYIISYTRTE